MPSGLPAPPPSPSATTFAWNWVIRELASYEEFDSSIFAAILRWDRSVVLDPVSGGCTMELLALKYLEELTTEFLHPSSSPTSAAVAPVPVSEALAHSINATSSSESILLHLLQEVAGLNGNGSCVTESWRNLVRQIVLEKKAMLHKSPMDLVKDMVLGHYEGDLPSNIIRCLRVGKRFMPADNSGDLTIVEKKLKLDNSHLPQEESFPTMSTESNLGLMKETSIRYELPLSEQNVQVGHHDNDACSRGKSIAPQCPVENEGTPQINPPANIVNKIQLPTVYTDHGQKISSDSSSTSESFLDAVPEFNVSDEVIAAETLKLLGSQNPVHNKSQPQEKMCVKCDKGGQVLLCTGSRCPIVVHESCLGLSVGAKNPEEFKCPFCSYLLAVTAFREAREKVSAAEKNLNSFMGWGRKRQNKKVQLPNSVGDTDNARKSSNGEHPDKLSIYKKLYMAKQLKSQNQVQIDVEGSDGYFSGGKEDALMDKNNSIALSDEAEQVNEYHVVSTSLNKKQAISATICDGGAQHAVFQQKDMMWTTECQAVEHKNDAVQKVCHEDPGTSKNMDTDKDSLAHETLDECNTLQHAEGMNFRHPKSTDSDTKSLPCQEIHVECEKVRKQGPTTGQNFDRKDSSVICCEERSSSNKGYKQRVNNYSKRYTNPVLPSFRRNRLPWTSEEEAILKEAMQKFYPSTETTTISWIKVLEFGRDVFHKTRQPIDLKDKWRNIWRKGESMKRKSSRTDGES